MHLQGYCCSFTAIAGGISFISYMPCLSFTYVALQDALDGLASLSTLAYGPFLAWLVPSASACFLLTVPKELGELECRV